MDLTQEPTVVELTQSDSPAAVEPISGLPLATADPNFPLAARLNRGRWYYQLRLKDSCGLHGPRTRWYPETKFSEAELASFSPLRDAVAVADELSVAAVSPPSPYQRPPVNARRVPLRRPRAHVLNKKPSKKVCGVPYGKVPPPSTYAIRSHLPRRS